VKSCSLGCHFFDENIVNKDGIDTHSVETQTYTDIDFKCNEYNFEGRSEKELSWHIRRIHGWSDSQSGEDMDQNSIYMETEVNEEYICRFCKYRTSDMIEYDDHVCENESESEQTNCFPCTFCEQSFQSRRELMEHKKKEHSGRVSVCWKFNSGKCHYGDEKCWFNHIAAKCEIKCNFREQTFPNQSEFLTHRKSNHEKFVPLCRNLPHGKCNYTDTNCWFKHKETEMINEHENNEKEIEENREVIQKMLQMMENFTKEIIQLKEMNNLH
jgi:hypothetical protein